MSSYKITGYRNDKNLGSFDVHKDANNMDLRDLECEER